MPSPDELSEKFRQWAVLKAQNDLTVTRMNKLRDGMMETVIASGDRDEKGNTHLPLPVEIKVGDKIYKAIKREARVSTTLNEDLAMAMAHNKGLQDDLIVHEPHIDIDALYAAYQRRQISEEELDGLFETKTSYAFKPVAQ